MLMPESLWLGQHLASVPDSELFPLLNVGSSTEHFRTQQQPYIDAHIFAPMRARGGEFWHLDMKQQPGVDIVGDLSDPAFLAELKNKRPKSVLVSNLFEHVPNRQEIAALIADLIPSGGYVFASGPYKYPYHADPIDNFFRPTVPEMAALFPGLKLVTGEIIKCGPWDSGRSVPRILARLMLPFYRPRKWLELARQSPYLFRDVEAVGTVLRKP